MKKIIFILVYILSISAYAYHPLLLAPNTTQINVVGAGDTVITLNRLLLVERVTYTGIDSIANVTFTSYRNNKQFANNNSIQTDVPLTSPPIKIPAGQNVTLNYILQQAKAYYAGLGYLVNIQ